MISIEKRQDNEEVVLTFDEEGGLYLISIINKLLKHQHDSHEHLYTKTWGGNELSEEVNYSDSTIVNMLTLFCLADDKQENSNNK